MNYDYHVMYLRTQLHKFMVLATDFAMILIDESIWKNFDKNTD